jgi:hypothetical protein
MTVETARAILRTHRREPSRLPQTDHTHADRLAFAIRMTRLRPRKFLRIAVHSR